jgi:hypothetical protein
MQPSFMRKKKDMTHYDILVFQYDQQTEIHRESKTERSSKCHMWSISKHLNYVAEKQPMNPEHLAILKWAAHLSKQANSFVRQVQSSLTSIPTPSVKQTLCSPPRAPPPPPKYRYIIITACNFAYWSRKIVENYLKDSGQMRSHSNLFP